MRIRRADIENDRGLLIGLLTRNLEGHGGEAHFDWLYRANPGGPARVWLVEDEAVGRAVGAAAAFPRAVRIDGKRRDVWNLGDFAIDKDFRSLGPALRLQRACVADVMEGRVALAYDHPSCNMMAIYRRLGVPEAGRVVRHVRPLRVDERVGSVAGENVAARGAAAIGNLLLSPGRRAAAALRRFRVDRHEGAFDERFDELDERASKARTVAGCRDARYLQWRYRDNPLGEFRVLTVARGGRLAGFVVLAGRRNGAVVSDLWGDPDDDVTDALFAAAIEACREDRAQALGFPAPQGGPLAPALERWGFRPRESVPFVVTVRPDADWGPTVGRATNWYLTHGDRDV